MKSHIYCQHGKKDVHRWLSKDILETAMAKKIPMMWKIAEVPKGKEYEDIDSKKKECDYCICLICKELRYYKRDCHINSDVYGFFVKHLKSECMAGWNSVAERYSKVFDTINEELVRCQFLLEQRDEEIAKLTKQLAAAEERALDFDQLVERLRTG